MTATANSYVFKNAWAAIGALPAAKTVGNMGSNNAYQNYALAMGGIDGGAAITATVYKTYGLNWTSEASLSGITRNTQGTQFNNFFYLISGGSGGTAGVGAFRKLSQGVWGTFADPTYLVQFGGAAVIPTNQSKIYVTSGYTDTSAAAADLTKELNTSDTASTSASSAFVSSHLGFAGISSKVYKVGGITNGTTVASTTSLNKGYNGTSWTSETAYPTNNRDFGIASGKLTGMFLGGQDSSGAILSSTYSFDTITFSALSSLLVPNFSSFGTQT